MNKFFVATAATLLAATPAFAQDEGTAPEGSEFNGVSAVALVGIDVLTIQENNAADTTRGLMYGGAIGYDHQVGKVVLGIQGEITSSQASYKVDGLLVPGDRFRSEAGRDLYAGIRVGMPVGRTLLYVGGGYVSSQLTSTYTSGATTIEETEDKGGFRVSMGAEIQRKNVFGRIEMRYQDLGDYTVFSSPTGFARTHTEIVAGLGVRF
ncbi:hypothetical protein P1X14_09530 [Sphingomonas sp. AOB5]|uniref:outer membrane protein n=1 Tax=Sphingomonas sp. AOB5 TaxID=3034017 RepID=UPI0023F890D2|nr:outer membrane beta-barrel protein [Sphingomonas sp. AOB5]MDF7775488.1 hypothetical protein [Sphingomonas sp. AOB5]